MNKPRNTNTTVKVIMRDQRRRRGEVAFNVKNGQGKSTLMVIDTEQTQIFGTGTFDLAQERFDVLVEPKLKRPGILSLRKPVRAFGTFKKPKFQVEKGPLLAGRGRDCPGEHGVDCRTASPDRTSPGTSTNCGDVQCSADSALKRAQLASIKKQ